MTSTKRRLDDYLEDLPPTFAPEAANDAAVLDSCSDTSDIDEPKAIPPPSAGPSRAGGPGQFQTPSAAGGSRNLLLSRQQGPLHPKAAMAPAVQATVGRGGKLQYTVPSSPQEGSYYAVQWRKPQTKKHISSVPPAGLREESTLPQADVAETWDGDAFIRIIGNRCALLSEDGGEQMGIASIGGGPPSEGTPLRIGNYDVEVDRAVTHEEFAKATCILNKNTSAKTLPTAYAPAIYAKTFKTPTVIKPPKPMGGFVPARTTDENAVIDLTVTPKQGEPSTSKAYQPVSAKSFYAAPPPKKVASKIVIGEKSAKQREEWGGAVFDPNQKGAVVMKRPPKEEAKRLGTEINDVVLDPLLAAKMRDHQKDGVKFMYSCVMKLTEAETNGCILADEMGLGKTLQTIALIHMLLRQSPYRNQASIIGKALIVCPVGLCDNWRKEFKKWTRSQEIGVIVADGSDQQITTFLHYHGQQVLIIGYERLRKHIKQLASCQPPIDLIVCDEGHRLKTKDNKTTKMFEALRTTRRIILSGTPVQNDLGEYWAMVDFCCPGLLGTYKQFFKHYEKPITKSREVGASAETVENGKIKAEELSKLSKEFVLRRTADVLNNYLPPKHEYVLFVAPSELQIKVYNSILSPSLAQSLIRGTGAGVQGLAMIDLLRKVSNTPLLLRKKDNEGFKSGEIGDATEAALEVIPRDLNMRDVSVSGKLSLLDKMLHDIHSTTQEKVVVVSNWTATLDIIQDVCKKRMFAYMRLDGSTNAKERQPLVDAFNRENRDQSFVFLLSAKAGGVGLNLIGASRLILFDSDWNPSTDLQAMARIHRDGQKKPVYIYRLLTTNTIDEKIYQRQITKTGLSDQMLDQKQGKDSKDSFSPAELKDIFTLRMTTDGCQTHDLLQCDCRTKPKTDILAEKDANAASSPEKDDGSDSEDETKKGFVHASQYDPTPSAKMLKKQAVEQQQKLAALKNWTHYDGFDLPSFKQVEDTILYNTMWHHYDTSRNIESSPVPSGIEDLSDSEWNKAAPKKKKPVRRDPDEEDEDGPMDRVMDSADEDEDSDNDSPRPSKKAKVVPANSRRPFGLSQDAKRYSLAKIAKQGGTGRVMFAFEKISSSKLMPSREGSEETK